MRALKYVPLFVLGCAATDDGGDARRDREVEQPPIACAASAPAAAAGATLDAPDAEDP